MKLVLQKNSGICLKRTKKLQRNSLSHLDDEESVGARTVA